MSTVECASCGSAVPGTGRFCPECGRPLEAAAPREGSRPRVPWALAGSAVLAVAGVALLAFGQWVLGLVLLLAAAAALVAGREAERRRAAGALGLAREKASAYGLLVTARSRAQLELFRLRRDLAELQAERGRGLHELGRATYEGDAAAADAARGRLDELGTRMAAKRDEIEALVRDVEHRIRGVRARVAPTERLESPPEPARVPEPFPPPDEGNPPEPARVPEPMPEPVPERAPDDPVPAPERAPAPETAERGGPSAKRA